MPQLHFKLICVEILRSNGLGGLQRAEAKDTPWEPGLVTSYERCAPELMTLGRAEQMNAASWLELCRSWGSVCTMGLI